MASFQIKRGAAMDVSITCECFARMAEIPMLIEDDEPRQYLKSVYLERRNKQLFMVVTNVKIAAIECIGYSDGPDECAAIAVTRQLIEQCEKETAFNSQLQIIANPALNFTTIKTTFGFIPPGNCGVSLPTDAAFFDWRKWLPDALPKKTHGSMRWNGISIHTLCIASPSGTLSFPEFIDMNKPVVINDFEHPHWIGVFMPSSTETPSVPAIIPDWAK